MKIVERVIDFLFPTICLECGQGEKIICENCFDKIEKKIKFDNQVLSIYSYKDKLVNELLWKLKYQHNGDIAKLFGKVLAQAIAKTDFRNIVLVPIPLSEGDKRMHNHAELLALAIKESISDIEVKNLLSKNTKKKQAHTKSKKERRENIGGTISIKRKELSTLSPDSTIVLIDDVSTTGATLNEARSVLMQELKKEVQAIVVAH